jgi:Ca-activated chloride channel family protein
MFDQGAGLAGGGAARTRAGVVSFAMAAPMPMSPAPMGKVAAPRRAMATGAPPPAPAQSTPSAPAAKGRSILGAIKDAFAPRAPSAAMPPPPPPPMLAEEADGFDDTLSDRAMAAPAVDALRAEAKAEGGADPILGLLTTQRASGLFADGDDERALVATTDALARLLAAGITSGHALYGEQVKRAIEAVVALATRLGARASVERALALAFLMASGKRTRRSVETAIDTLAPTLRPRLGDEGALRQSIGA